MVSILLYLHKKMYDQECTVMLRPDQISVIKSWFVKYSSLSFTTEKALSLMMELFQKENLDMYPCDEYQRVVKTICTNYGVDAMMFREMASEFREIIAD